MWIDETAGATRVPTFDGSDIACLAFPRFSVELTYNCVDSDKFFDFIRGTLISNMQPFDGSNTKSIVILDNCSIHHVEPVKELLHDAGILLIFLPLQP